MANEITISVSLAVTKDGRTVSLGGVKQETLLGSGNWSNTQNIGTSAEQVSFPADLTAEGITHLIFKNLDATNYIQLSLDNFTQIFAKLMPGQYCYLPTNSGNPTVYAKANTAACNLAIGAAGT